MIAITARCHVHCMTFYQAKFLGGGSCEMMSLRDRRKVLHTRRQSKGWSRETCLTGSFRILSVIS